MIPGDIYFSAQVEELQRQGFGTIHTATRPRKRCMFFKLAPTTLEDIHMELLHRAGLSAREYAEQLNTTDEINVELMDIICRNLHPQAEIIDFMH